MQKKMDEIKFHQKCKYKEYILQAHPKKMYNGRYAVRVLIMSNMEKKQEKAEFCANDKIWYILEIEAAKESLNLGRNLIDKSLVGF